MLSRLLHVIGQHNPALGPQRLQTSDIQKAVGASRIVARSASVLDIRHQPARLQSALGTVHLLQNHGMPVETFSCWSCGNFVQAHATQGQPPRLSLTCGSVAELSRLVPSQGNLFKESDTENDDDPPRMASGNPGLGFSGGILCPASITKFSKNSVKADLQLL